MLIRRRVWSLVPPGLISHQASGSPHRSPGPEAASGPGAAASFARSEMTSQARQRPLVLGPDQRLAFLTGGSEMEAPPRGFGPTEGPREPLSLVRHPRPFCRGECRLSIKVELLSGLPDPGAARGA